MCTCTLIECSGFIVPMITLKLNVNYYLYIYESIVLTLGQNIFLSHLKSIPFFVIPIFFNHNKY